MNLMKAWHALEPHERFKELLDATALQLQQELEEDGRGGSPQEPHSEAEDSQTAYPGSSDLLTDDEIRRFL